MREIIRISPNRIAMWNCHANMRWRTENTRCFCPWVLSSESASRIASNVSDAIRFHTRWWFPLLVRGALMVHFATNLHD